MLKLPVIEMDQQIARNEGMTIPEIFARGGEAEFRALEREETAKRAFEDALMEQVADNITADVPDAMVEAQARQYLDNFKMQLAQQGIQMIYDETHMVLAQGNFVLAASEGTYGGAPTSYYDLWRVENGKIAEHWDVMETIAAPDAWQNQNGKF